MWLPGLAGVQMRVCMALGRGLAFTRAEWNEGACRLASALQAIAGRRGGSP